MVKARRRTMERFSQQAAGRMAHAYIISSPDQAQAQRRASEMAAAALCTSADLRPCGQCRDCRKVAAGIHPDVITVGRLPGGDSVKKEIGVEQIRGVSADAVILPNEGRRKVYIIREADTMNLYAQNAALKLLEESPAQAMFLLCVSNPDRLLPTVRSRCAEVNLNADAAGDEESVRLAEEYLAAAAAGPAELYAWCAANDGLDQSSALAFLNSAAEVDADMLCLRRDSLGMAPPLLLELAGLIRRCLAYLGSNVSVKLIFGLLATGPAGG